MLMLVAKLSLVCTCLMVFGPGIMMRWRRPCFISYFPLVNLLALNHTLRGRRIIFFLCPYPFSILCDVAEFFFVDKM